MDTNIIKQKAQELKKILEKFESIFVITGAGVSTPSGIPDFRSKDGIYSYTSENIFDIRKFIDDPRPFYKFCSDFYGKVKNAKPNPAHYLIAKLEEKNKLSLLLTQNIDGLHQKAGSKKISEIHGNFKTLTCLKCGSEYSLGQFKNYIENGKTPKCKKCDAVLKPDVTFFGEGIDPEVLIKGKKAAESSDLCLVMGSSLCVYPTASFPQISLSKGGKLIIINIGQTPYDDYAYKKYEIDVSLISEQVLKLYNN